MAMEHLFATAPKDMVGCTKVRLGIVLVMGRSDPKTKSSVPMECWKPITITGVSSIVQNTNARAATG